MKTIKTARRRQNMTGNPQQPQQQAVPQQQAQQTILQLQQRVQQLEQMLRQKQMA